MTLYERMQLLAAKYDLLNAEFHELNRQLRMTVIEAQVEKHAFTRAFRKFIRDMKRNDPFRN